jgi:excisionase family DNA binding protein
MYENENAKPKPAETGEESENDRAETMPPLFTISEVAKYLQVSTTTVYRLIRDGALKGTRIGQSLRFTRKNIEDLLESCAVDKND